MHQLVRHLHQVRASQAIQAALLCFWLHGVLGKYDRWRCSDSSSKYPHPRSQSTLSLLLIGAWVWHGWLSFSFPCNLATLGVRIRAWYSSAWPAAARGSLLQNFCVGPLAVTACFTLTVGFSEPIISFFRGDPIQGRIIELATTRGELIKASLFDSQVM